MPGDRYRPLLDSYQPSLGSQGPHYPDRGPRLRRAGKRDRGTETRVTHSIYGARDRPNNGGIHKRPATRARHVRGPRDALNTKAVQKIMPPSTPFRGFFLVPQAHWQRIETYLSQNGLQYEYFHASFINACHKLVRRVDNPDCRNAAEWELQIRQILKEYPVSATKYIEALQSYKDTCDPPKDEIAGRPIKSTSSRLSVLSC